MKSATMIVMLIAGNVLAQDTFQKSTTGSSVIERDVVFFNSTKLSCRLLWVDFDGKEIEYTAIAAGAKVEASSQCGHLWRIRQNGHVINKFRVSDAASQTFEIKPPATHGKPPGLKQTGSIPKLKPPSVGKHSPPPPPKMKKMLSAPRVPSTKVALPPPPSSLAGPGKKLPPPPAGLATSGMAPKAPLAGKAPLAMKPKRVGGQPSASDRRVTWRDVEHSTLQRQPDGSWVLSAKGELASMFGVYERLTEKSRTPMSVSLVSSKGHPVELYDGIVVLTDPRTKQVISGLPGRWSHMTDSRPVMTHWKSSTDGTTVTRQPDGNWLYFKPGANPQAIDAVNKDDCSIMFQDNVSGRVFMLCRGVALQYEEATGSFKPTSKGDWVQPEAKSSPVP